MKKISEKNPFFLSNHNRLRGFDLNASKPKHELTLFNIIAPCAEYCNKILFRNCRIFYCIIVRNNLVTFSEKNQIRKTGTYSGLIFVLLHPEIYLYFPIWTDTKLSRFNPIKNSPGSRDFNSKNFLKPNLNSRVYKQYRFALHTTSAVL